MIDTNAIRKKVLDLAIEGKLTERDTVNKTINLFNLVQQERNNQLKNGILKKTKVFPKITKEKIPGDFPQEWYICYVDDIAFVTKLAGFEYTKYIADSIQNKGIPLFKGKNVQHGKLVLEFEDFIPQSVSDGLPRSQLKKKCLLTPYVGTIGNIAIFEGDFDAHLGSNVGKIEIMNSADEIYILEEYVLYYLRSSYGYAELTKHKKATAQDSISIEAIRNVIIPIPSVKEQKAIVGRIDEVFEQLDIIDELQVAYTSDIEILKSKLIDAGIQGKLTEQLPEDGTAEALYEEIQKEKDRLIKDKKIKKQKVLPEISEEEIPFEIPDNWKWVKWGDLSQSIQYGYNAPAKQEGRIKMVRISDIQAGNVLWDTVPYCDIDECDIETYMLHENDILFARTGGTVGKSYIVTDIPEEAVYAGYLIRTSYSSKLCAKYMKYFMESRLYWRQLQNGTIATAQPNCNGQTLSRMIVPLPPYAEQVRIVEKLENLLELI